MQVSFELFALEFWPSPYIRRQFFRHAFWDSWPVFETKHEDLVVKIKKAAFNAIIYHIWANCSRRISKVSAFLRESVMSQALAFLHSWPRGLYWWWGGISSFKVTKSCSCPHPPLLFPPSLPYLAAQLWWINVKLPSRMAVFLLCSFAMKLRPCIGSSYTSTMYISEKSTLRVIFKRWFFTFNAKSTLRVRKPTSLGSWLVLISVFDHCEVYHAWREDNMSAGFLPPIIVIPAFLGIWLNKGGPDWGLNDHGLI